MNLKQLEIFVAIAESGSFSRGAEATFLTQSTVSQHIASLEEELGVKLLNRLARGAHPTEGGKILLRQAQQVLAGIRDLQQAMERFKGVEDAHLSVAASTIPGDYMVPLILAPLLERYPGITLTLLHGDSREVIDRLERDEVELALVGSRFDDDGLLFTPFGSDELLLVVGRSHPWWQRSSATVSEVAQEPFILREAGSGTGKTLTEALAKVGIPPEQMTVKARLGSNEAVKHAVTAGIGISFISSLSIRSELERGELWPIEVDGLTVRRQFYLVQRLGREPSPAAQAFASLLLAHFVAPRQ
jgi:DNA-binding transcriptional LysR family regulator